MKASEKPYGLKGGIIRRNNEMHQYFNLGSLIIQLTEPISLELLTMCPVASAVVILNMKQDIIQNN